jgi:hypothetical protein
MPGLEESALPVQALVRIVAQRKRPVDLITELGLEVLTARPLISRTTRPLRHLGIGVSKMKTAEAMRRGRFCDFVAEQTDEATLARMWDGPDEMPSWPEVEEPRLWLARTVWAERAGTSRQSALPPPGSPWHGASRWLRA